MRMHFFKHSFIAVPFLLGLFFFAGLTDVHAAKNFGLTTTNQLISFNTPFPGNVTTIGPITGLQSGEIILGIDTRPATGELYGLGSSSRIYKINKTTAVATAVGGAFTPTLSGTNFGFDFNPTVDRIRIVSNTGQNLRANPNDGTVIVDGTLNPGSPSVTAAAYFNNFAGATSTILYVIDTANDTLYQQNPANSGTLVPVGSLGVDATGVNGFDYNSGDNTALAALTVGGVSGIYKIDLVFGTATLIGQVGGNLTLRGLTGDIAQQTKSYTAIGLTTSNQLVTFSTARPDMITNTVSITGLQGGENIVGIDFRPAGGQLFGISSSNRVYVINTTTGAATSVGTLTTPLSGTSFGVDFNPTVDRIRIVSDADQNLRANPNDGSNVVDGTLAYGAGDPNAGQNPNVVAAAYTNSFANATTTSLFDIDSNLDIVVQQNPANAGTLQTITPLGLDATNNVGYDIEGSSNTGFAAIQLNGDSSSKFYIINTSPMSPATFIGLIGGQANRVLLSGLAIVPGSSAVVPNRPAALNLLDFTGDARADYVVFRPSNNFWYINPSSAANGLMFTGQAFGNSATDVLTPGDYDGDGITDLAVWRRTTGTFFVLRSSDNSVAVQQFGQNGDEPVARDYDGDGKTDYAVVRRTGGQLIWFILNSSNGSFSGEQFGVASDVVAPGDYDGDGKFDLAVFRGMGDQPATFFVKQSSNNAVTNKQFGLGSDLVVPGDYDGDGKTDYAVVRTGTSYQWFILRSSDNSIYSVQFGTKPDYTTQNDYDGDGKTDVSVYRPQTGTFFVLNSSGGVTARQFGQNGDYPVANYDTH